MKKRSFWLYKRSNVKDSKIKNQSKQLNGKDCFNNTIKEVQKGEDEQAQRRNQPKATEVQEKCISKQTQSDNSKAENNIESKTPQKGYTFREILKNWNMPEQSDNVKDSDTTHRDINNREISNGFELENGQVQISDALINNLIDNFINKRFQTRDSQLNSREDSTIKDYGFEKWDTMQLVKHKVTKEYGKMLKDKYGYKKDEKKSEAIPLSFYFDLSGSMREYSHILSLIALKILQKKIKLLIGYNDNVVYQIDELPKDKKISVEEFQAILDENMMDKTIKNEKLKYQVINQQLDEYLIENNAEKVALFTDFDPINAIKNLSNKTELYWFCFEKYKAQPFNFKGRFFRIERLDDIIFYMRNIDKPYIKKDKEEVWR